MARTGLVAGIVLGGMALCGLPAGLVFAGDISPVQHDQWFKNPNPDAAPPIVQHYDPAPALWQLSDDDTTIYLFGTIHALPKTFRWRSPQFDRIVAESDELIVESADADLGNGDIESLLVDMFRDAPNRTPTSKRLSPEASAKWLKILRQSDMPVKIADRLPPLFTLMSIGVGFSIDAGSTSENGVETVLEAEFARAGKPVGSIEEALPVLSGLIGIDEDMTIAQLEEDLAAWDGNSLDSFMMEESIGQPGEASIDAFAMEHAWASGTVSKTDMFGDTPLDEAMRKVLLTDRNRAWAVWLDDRLDRPGTVLVAVGAGHFEGDVSVLAMLAKRGLTARRIN